MYSSYHTLSFGTIWECQASWPGCFAHEQRAAGAHWTGEGGSTEWVWTFWKSKRPLASAGSLRSPNHRPVTTPNELCRKQVITIQSIPPIC